MPDVIRDGTGKGFLAAVNSNNQLVTRATAIEQRLVSAIDKNYYEATTGQITLTDAVETGIIYIENGEDLLIIIDRVFFDIWESTSGTGGGILKYYINPTVAGGSAIVPTNTYFDSSNTLSGTFSKSLSSISGTAWWTAYISAGTSSALEEGRIVIPKGRSFGISITAPASNTSMKVSIDIAMFLFDPLLLGQ